MGPGEEAKSLPAVGGPGHPANLRLCLNRISLIWVCDRTICLVTRLSQTRYRRPDDMNVESRTMRDYVRRSKFGTEARTRSLYDSSILEAVSSGLPLPRSFEKGWTDFEAS